MSDQLLSVLPSILVLGAAAMLALSLTMGRGWSPDSGVHIRGAVRIALIVVLFQAVHFTEELWTGFHERLPGLFGLAPIPLGLFVAFNLGCLAVWLISVWGLAKRSRIALFPLWFLGVASLANGFLHPLLSVVAGAYFPGLATAPLAGVLGFLLLRRLLLITDAAPVKGTGARHGARTLI